MKPMVARVSICFCLHHLSVSSLLTNILLLFIILLDKRDVSDAYVLVPVTPAGSIMPPPPPLNSH
jgi:hypothetical protein